jgi:hypothetical protein
MSKFPSMMLDEEIKAFYEALGKAITQWQAVEEWLAIIFSGLISDDTRSHMTSNAAFHAVVNISAKVAMIDSAIVAKAFWSAFERPAGQESPMYAAWRPLKHKLDKRIDRRNEMAHFAMHTDDKKKPGHRCYLAPNVLNVKALIKHAGKPPTRNTCALILHGNSFETLAWNLQSFYTLWVAR